MFDSFHIGRLVFSTQLFFICLGVYLSVAFFLRLAQRAGLSVQQFKDRALWYVGAAIIGGRLVAVLEQYRSYIHPDDPFRVLMLHDGKFSFLGAAIGIALVLGTTKGQSRTTFLQWLDVLLPTTCFGLFFTWVGKLASGQAYGVPTDAFWGITYDAIDVRYTVPIHPVQLYYAVFYFALTFILLIVRKHAKRAGAETLVGIVWASLATFFLEYFRGDFSIPVFATVFDFLLLFLLFVSLGILALIQPRLSQRFVLYYEGGVTLVCAVYLVLRMQIEFSAYELRFSQLMAVLALLAAVVYVVVHRRLHPHL